MKKQLFSLFALALVLMLALTACTSASPSASESPSESPSPSEQPSENPSQSPSEEPSESPSEEPSAPANNQDGLVGELTGILSSAALGEIGEMEEGLITAENCQMYTGLTPEQLSQYVKEAAYSRPFISSSAHNVVLIECADEAAAAEVKALVAAGFDPGQWVCVYPDYCFVQESGSTVILVASTEDVVNKMKTAFSSYMGGNVGKVNEFFDKSMLE